MPRFHYQRRHQLEPRPGRSYSTTYIKQTEQQYQELRDWLVSVAEQCVAVCDQDRGWQQWFHQPLKAFRRSRPGDYYTPEQLLTDMIQQMALGRDLSQAMIDRWNRLCSDTPWQIELVVAKQPATAQAQDWVAH